MSWSCLIRNMFNCDQQLWHSHVSPNTITWICSSVTKGYDMFASHQNHIMNLLNCDHNLTLNKLRHRLEHVKLWSDSEFLIRPYVSYRGMWACTSSGGLVSLVDARMIAIISLRVGSEGFRKRRTLTKYCAHCSSLESMCICEFTTAHMTSVK